jgi:ATP-dependent Lhr-like helicase
MERPPLQDTPDVDPDQLGADATRVLSALRDRGASFFSELARETGLLPVQAELAVSELSAQGLCTTDGISGLRTLIAPQEVLRRAQGRGGRGADRRRRASMSPLGLEWAGRIGWAARSPEWKDDVWKSRPAEDVERELEETAHRLLLRWGIVFRRLLKREAHLPPWRELLRVLFRLEAQGRVRGGRFVTGVSGEQFALPEAVAALRGVRSSPPGSERILISPADPLNLAGILTGDPVMNRAQRGDLVISQGRFLSGLRPDKPASGADLRSSVAGQ